MLQALLVSEYLAASPSHQLRSRTSSGFWHQLLLYLSCSLRSWCLRQADHCHVQDMVISGCKVNLGSRGSSCVRRPQFAMMTGRVSAAGCRGGLIRGHKFYKLAQDALSEFCQIGRRQRGRVSGSSCTDETLSSVKRTRFSLVVFVLLTWSCESCTCCESFSICV